MRSVDATSVNSVLVVLARVILLRVSCFEASWIVILDEYLISTTNNR